MTDTDEAERPLTPEALDYTHLPDQTMYKVSLDDASHFEQGGDDIRTYPVCITNEFKLLYFEMDPGAVIDWHTHAPSFDEVCLCLDGAARYTLKREDGSEQVIRLNDASSSIYPVGHDTR